jgi:hypothetical protein
MLWGEFGVVCCGLVVMEGEVRPEMPVVPVPVPVLPPAGAVIAPPLAWLKAGGSRKTAAAKTVIALP